jgi:hypothetical protein
VAQSQYWIEITNEHLDKYRKVTGRTRREVELKAHEQLQRWADQEARARQRAAVADAKEQALLDTDAALSEIEEHRTILSATLAIDDRLNWQAMIDMSVFNESKPSLADVYAELSVPSERAMAERFSKKKRDARLQAAQRAEEPRSPAIPW